MVISIRHISSRDGLLFLLVSVRRLGVLSLSIIPTCGFGTTIPSIIKPAHIDVQERPISLGCSEGGMSSPRVFSAGSSCKP